MVTSGLGEGAPLFWNPSSVESMILEAIRALFGESSQVSSAIAGRIGMLKEVACLLLESIESFF